MSKPKILEEMSFDELVDDAARDIHSSLLESGGAGLKNAVYKWLNTTAYWRDLQNGKEGDKQ